MDRPWFISRRLGDLSRGAEEKTRALVGKRDTNRRESLNDDDDDDDDKEEEEEEEEEESRRSKLFV